MIVYFTGSITSHEHNKKHYEHIVASLKHMGHEVIADHILNNNEEAVEKKPRTERLSFNRQVEQWIQSCNCMIAETSVPSVSVGYEIAMATRIGVPVLILHRTGEGPSLLAHHKNEQILVEKYTPATIASILEDYMAYVKDNRDIKFTFYLSRKYIMYMDEAAKTKQMTKSGYLRWLIEQDMQSSQ